MLESIESPYFFTRSRAYAYIHTYSVYVTTSFKADGLHTIGLKRTFAVRTKTPGLGNRIDNLGGGFDAGSYCNVCA